jgi:hypothetical protein
MTATTIDSQSPGDAGDPINLPRYIFVLMINIAQFHKLIRERGCFRTYSSPRI